MAITQAWCADCWGIDLTAQVVVQNDAKSKWVNGRKVFVLHAFLRRQDGRLG